MRAIRLMLVLVLTALLCTACSGSSYPDTSVVTCGNELVFSFSLEDFIHSYNGQYSRSHHRDYLRPEAQWMRFTDAASPFSDNSGRYYRFSYDETVLTAPTISVYTTSSGTYVSGITVDFDDHGYSDYHYRLYEEQCYYTVKALLPDCSDEVITQMCATLTDRAYANIQPEEMNADTVPELLYWQDSVGVFSYFATGEFVHLCVIPVTADRISQLQELGAEVVEIDDAA